MWEVSSRRGRKMAEYGDFKSRKMDLRVDLENRPQSRGVLTVPQNSNPVGIVLKDAAHEGGQLNHRRGLIQISNNSTGISRSSAGYPPKLALKFKVPPKVVVPRNMSESCSLAPGTGVYYTSRRSITSKGYGKVCIVEALSLLADVSCDLNRVASNSTPKLSENADDYEERFNQRPWEMNMASAEKNCKVHPYCKESYTDKPCPKKMSPLLAKENSYKVVRKLRTPRRTSQSMFHCPTKIQTNISLSMCEEYFSRIGASSSLTGIKHLRERQAMFGNSPNTSATNKENLLGEGKFSDDKSTTNIIQIPRAVQNTATLERVSKALYQLCGTKKKPFKGLRRAERFTQQILRFIGEMTVPERLIRQALGNNPDTSKALRLLLTERKVMRLGSGGRGRAYEYVATEKGLHQLRELEQTANEVVELTPESASASSRSSVAGPTIVSDASKSEAQCFPIQGMRNPIVSAAGTNQSRPSSVTPPVTPHRFVQRPAQRMNCITSSQSFDLSEYEITEC